MGVLLPTTKEAAEAAEAAEAVEAAEAAEEATAHYFLLFEVLHVSFYQN